MNIIFCVNKRGVVSTTPALSLEDSILFFNRELSSKNLILLALKECAGSLPRNLDRKMVEAIIRESGASGIFIESNLDIDHFVIDAFDSIWEAKNKKYIASYFEIVKNFYGRMLFSRLGNPIVLLTTEDYLPYNLKDCKSSAELGTQFTAYYSDELSVENPMFSNSACKKIKHLVKMRVRQYES